MKSREDSCVGKDLGRGQRSQRGQEEYGLGSIFWIWQSENSVMAATEMGGWRWESELGGPLSEWEMKKLQESRLRKYGRERRVRVGTSPRPGTGGQFILLMIA